MSRLPKVAIVGRPNVGKSALFNRICGKRIAIVDEAEGITRDRIYGKSDLFGRPFELIDTGGIDARSKAAFNEEVKQQAEIAIEEADSLIMVVDARLGPMTLDHELAEILLRTKKPVTLAINKVDNTDQKALVHQFYSLGIQTMVAVSAIQGHHMAELLEGALDPIEQDGLDDGFESTRVAIIGRPNVGKSTLINQFLDEDRCIVSPIAGTTRDSIDVHFSFEDHNYTLIDTAGIRRKKAEHEVVDKFAAIRAKRAIERADVCLLVVDAQEGLTHQEKRIANMIEEAGKGCVLLFNKWDLVKGFRMEHCVSAIKDEASFLKHCPMMCVSALEGRNMDKILEAVDIVRKETEKRISTGQLNKFIERALQLCHPPMIQGKRLRLYYLTQVSTLPPKFILFVNKPKLMTGAYKKYLINRMREQFQFTGLPLEFILKGKPERQAKAAAFATAAPSLANGSEESEDLLSVEAFE